MINNWLKAQGAQSHYLRIFFIDLSKVLDRINHNILVKKLLLLGVRQSIIPWICDSLTNWRQAVTIDGCRSDWVGGVTQGTKFGLILFLVMINDLELKSPLASFCK